MNHEPESISNRLVAAIAVVLTFCTAAAAIATDPPEAQPPEPVGEPTVPPPPGGPPPPTSEELAAARPIVFELKARGELGFNADFRDDPGDVTVTRLGAGFGVGVPVRRFGQLDVGLDYEFSHYRFSGATGSIPGVESPWENIHRETLTIRYSQQQTLQLAWFVGGSVGFAHEEGAALGDSLVGSAFGGIRFALSESVAIGAGLAVLSRLEESPLIVPLPSIDWQMTERTRLTTGGGLGLALAYAASETLTFSLGGKYELREFRLREDGPAAGGVGQDRRIPIAMGIAYKPTRHLSFEVSGGAYLGQQIRVIDTEGNTTADLDLKPTPFAALQIAYRF